MQAMRAGFTQALYMGCRTTVYHGRALSSVRAKLLTLNCRRVPLELPRNYLTCASAKRDAVEILKLTAFQTGPSACDVRFRQTSSLNFTLARMEN